MSSNQTCYRPAPPDGSVVVLPQDPLDAYQMGREHGHQDVARERLERIAADAMAAMISSPDPHCTDWDPKQMALNSIMYARALIAAIDAEEEKKP